MYREGTIPQRFRLSESDINICKNYLQQIPLSRVLNQALGIYIYNIQRTVIPAILLYSGTNTERRNGKKKPVSVRLRRNLVEYMDVNCINKTRAIEEALSLYIRYLKNHKSELEYLRRSNHYWCVENYPKY